MAAESEAEFDSGTCPCSILFSATCLQTEDRCDYFSILKLDNVCSYLIFGIYFLLTLSVTPRID